MTVRHALQAFSPQYFSKNGNLFSYSRENFAAARGLSGERSLPCFFTSGLSEPGEEFRNITVDGLCGFFSNPSRYLLTKRLGLHFGANSGVLEDREPLTIMDLDRYELEKDLLSKALQGRDTGHRTGPPKSRRAYPLPEHRVNVISRILAVA